MNDTSRIWNRILRDLIIAFSLISIIPMPRLKDDEWTNPADAAWCFPLVGAALGTVSGLVGYSVLAMGFSAIIAAIFCVTSMIILTGAMHEDGLSDCADGLGGRSPEKRLLIMKDSQIGTFGALALMISVLLRVTLYGELAADTLFFAAIAAGALSRAPLGMLGYALPFARNDGLSRYFGKPSLGVAIGAIAIGVAIGCIWIGAPVITATFGIAIATLAIAYLAKRLLGGQTGDVYGAAQQSAEICALLGFVVFL